MGDSAACRSVQRALSRLRPDIVLTCGFAGGLNPDLSCGALVAQYDPDFPLAHGIETTGAISATLFSSERVLVTAREKKEAWERSQADAVEMESSTIRHLCAQAGIPSATFRVISDAADQDLPLDFNRLILASGRFSYRALILSLIRSPDRIRPLIELQRQTRKAANILGSGLQTILSCPSPA